MEARVGELLEELVVASCGVERGSRLGSLGPRLLHERGGSSLVRGLRGLANDVGLGLGCSALGLGCRALCRFPLPRGNALGGLQVALLPGLPLGGLLRAQLSSAPLSGLFVLLPSCAPLGGLVVPALFFGGWHMLVSCDCCEGGADGQSVLQERRSGMCISCLADGCVAVASSNASAA